jgi:hypothetical protein
MKVVELLSNIKELKVNRSELARKSEGGVTLSKLLPTLDKMYELMKMAEEADISKYSDEKGEIEAMKKVINSVLK